MAEKKFPLYLPIIMIIVVVLLCKNDLQSKETEIAAYIVNNQDTLTTMASAILDSGSETVPLIDGVNDVTCWNGADSCVAFQYYSIGFGDSVGTHYGFYYSPQDIPSAYGAQDIVLVSRDNGWSWTDADNSSGYTKKIMDNWYYYETSY